jgi:hypothetical protein
VPDLDVVIFGGGIAGLWTLARLTSRGYAAGLVVQAGPEGVLGGRQTLASQGIIHGGVKYALGGAASRASRAIAAMPELWTACLSGTPPAHEPDLSSAQVLSPRQYLWSTGSLGSKLVAIAASKAIRTPVRRLDEAERPPGLRVQDGARAVDVYEVDEAVLEPRSVIEALAGPRRRQIGTYAETRPAGGAFEVFVGDTRAVAKAAVLCAGEGNPPLLGLLAPGAVATPVQQVRPLHMVYVRAAGNDPEEGGLPALYGHALAGLTGVSGADKPRVTVTTQGDGAGRTVWNVGGLIAETGVERPRHAQVEHAKKELAACVGWVSLERGGGAEFATLRVNRAEGFTPGGSRPDEPVVRAFGRVIAAWPTKLAFAPEMARRVDDALVAAGVEPSGCTPDLRCPHQPMVGPLPWDDAMEWTA